MRKLLSGLVMAAAASVLALVPVGAADAVSATAQSGKVVHFTSPSGNIDCFLSSDRDFGKGAYCAIQKDDWASHKKRPANCHLDWVPTDVSLSSRGRVTVGACRGDIGPICEHVGGPASNLGNCSVLKYGHTVTAGNIRCASTKRGITCRTTNGDRHGFRVSRAALHRF